MSRFWPAPNPPHPTLFIYVFYLAATEKAKGKSNNKSFERLLNMCVKIASATRNSRTRRRLASPIYGRKAPFYGGATPSLHPSHCSWLCLGLWRSVTRARRMHFDLCALFTQNSCRQSCFPLLCLRCLCPLLALLGEPCQFANSSVGRQLSGLCPRAAVDISNRRQQVERRLRN